jgi:hypothetical protein
MDNGKVKIGRGSSDTGAYHRAIDVASQFEAASLWDGESAIVIHDRKYGASELMEWLERYFRHSIDEVGGEITDRVRRDADLVYDWPGAPAMLSRALDCRPGELRKLLGRLRTLRCPKCKRVSVVLDERRRGDSPSKRITVYRAALTWLSTRLLASAMMTGVVQRTKVELHCSVKLRPARRAGTLLTERRR